MLLSLRSSLHTQPSSYLTLLQLLLPEKGHLTLLIFLTFPQLRLLLLLLLLHILKLEELLLLLLLLLYMIHLLEVVLLDYRCPPRGDRGWDRA